MSRLAGPDVVPAAWGSKTQVRWGDDHRAIARVNTAWLADLITRVERCPELLERIPVVVTNLAVRRGRRWS
ncbi:MAG: lantibiotic dehydratase [Pseudonocardiaceae bacterium]